LLSGFWYCVKVNNGALDYVDIADADGILLQIDRRTLFVS